MATLKIEQDRYQPGQWLLWKNGSIVGYFRGPNAERNAKAALRRKLDKQADRGA